jgi:polyphosphate kinase
VAPVNMRERFIALIDREFTHCQAGRPARIIAKLNQLEDRAMCQALARADQAGMSIDVIVRGFCMLPPGLPGLSERIRVISVIGRFLEHSRIYYFQNGE